MSHIPYFREMGNIVAVVLAGGKGTRLYPLTKSRAKPAVHFAAKYRIVDFALSNLINSGIYSTFVLTQFKSQSLTEHIERGWQFGDALRGRDFFITPVPAQMWTGDHWYQGTADAVFQNFHLLYERQPDRVAIFAADHVYKMDIRQMLQFHVEKRADMTISAIRVPKREASGFGIIKVDEEGRIIDFIEKPKDPPTIPGSPNMCYASMGNYIFEWDLLKSSVIEDAHDKNSEHDFGKNIIPKIYKTTRLFAYDFSNNIIPGDDRPYWRDVGTLHAYWQAHMDLLKPNAELNLFNPKWPIRTVSYADPPGFTYPVAGQTCSVVGALRAEGSQVLGATVSRCVLGRNCIIRPGATLDECIIGGHVVVGEGCKLRRAVIPPNTAIGYDPETDAAHYHVDESGIVVVAMPEPDLGS